MPRPTECSAARPPGACTGCARCRARRSTSSRRIAPGRRFRRGSCARAGRGSTWPRATVQLGAFRVLSPVCTLLTLAGLFNDHRFERAAEDAWHLKLVTPEQAASFLDAIRGSGRLGVSRFDRWLQRTAARSRPSQSGFELDVLDALEAVGLPEPQRQYPLTLATGEVVHLDIAWPEAMLAVEPGHSWWHGGDLKMAADYDRDGACGEVGWHVARLSEAARRDLAGAAARIRNTYIRTTAASNRQLTAESRRWNWRHPDWGRVRPGGRTGGRRRRRGRGR